MLVRDIIQATAQAGGISVPALLSPERRLNVVRLRHVGMLATTRLTSRSFPAIGTDWGGRDHSTVMNAVSRAAQLLDQGEEMTCGHMRRLLDILDVDELPRSRPEPSSVVRDRAMIGADICRFEKRLTVLRAEMAALIEAETRHAEARLSDLQTELTALGETVR